MFSNAVDIANRGLQHCGAERIDPALGFAEDSKRARETSFVYDKVRRAELRRNVWKFATRKAILRAVDDNTRLLAPSMWVSSTTYFVGSIVSDETGYLWMSAVPDNLGNQPEDSSTWAPYFGPMTAMLYDATQSYSAGELVYTTAGDGTYRVYLSLQNGNSDTPATATAWDATATYIKNQVVTYSAVTYMSLIDFNLNQQPSLAPAAWASGTTYSAAQKAGGSDGVIYQSIAGGNLGNDPTIDAGAHWTNTGVLTPWTTVFVGGAGSAKWLEIGGAEFPSGVGLSGLGIVYPIGTGPSTQETTRNVFRLPANFLRQAPQDPKAGSTNPLGAPTELAYRDWLYEGPYLISSEVGPIVFRFVADITDVTMMDDMFCEGLGCRIGIEVCEPLTQSSDKLKTIRESYTVFMREARLVNSIEEGAEEAPLDDYIACRY